MEGNTVIPALKLMIAGSKGDSFLFETAMSALYQIKTPQALDVMRELLASNDTQKAQFARSFLLGLKDERTVRQELPVVLQALKTADPTDKATAITNSDLLWNLEKFANAGVDKTVLEDAVQPFLAANNQLAIYLLRTFGSEKSIDALLKITNAPENKDNEYLRTSAMTTLSMLKDHVPEKQLPVLLSTATSPDVLQRRQGAQALARLGDKLALPILAELAQKETDPTAQLFQTSAIYAIGGPQAIQLLNQLHQHALQTNNAALKEQTEEAQLRLTREGRAN